VGAISGGSHSVVWVFEIVCVNDGRRIGSSFFHFINSPRLGSLVRGEAWRDGAIWLPRARIPVCFVQYNFFFFWMLALARAG
jgi:hypothetical protein